MYGISKILCSYSEWDCNFYNCNDLGSTRQLTDNNGIVVADYTYDAFGNVVSSFGSVANSYGFTGERQFDEVDNLVFLRARYYNTKVGRFINRDPILAPMRTEDNFTWALPSLNSHPKLFHPYVYCGNNPVNLVDPEGQIVDWVYHCIQCLRYLSKAMDDAKECREANPCDTKARWKCMNEKPNFKKAMEHCTKCGIGSWTNPGPSPAPRK